MIGDLPLSRFRSGNFVVLGLGKQFCRFRSSLAFLGWITP